MKRDVIQATAAQEGVPANEGDTIANRDALQARALIEGPLLDDGDAVGDCVTGPCLTCRISMQHRLLFIKQNPIYIRVIQIFRANLNYRQTAAAREGVVPDAGNAVANRDAPQVGAEGEGLSPNADDTIRYRDTRQAAAIIEGVPPDAFNTVRNRNTRKGVAFLEGPFTDTGDRLAFDSRRYG